MRRKAEDLRRDGLRLGVVPTMGALHEGHLSLLRRARAACDIVVVTIFVNPTQFGPGEDLDAYPRDEATDLQRAVAEGANLAFCPATEAMYPPGFQTKVEVQQLSQGLCGAFRPGHFAGVATVVTKLFNVTRPHAAFFGQKDYQQLALIRRLNQDLDFDIDIVGCPIVREEDGLALSSRNRYLSPAERAQAPALHRGLRAAAALFESGERAVRTLIEAARAVVEQQPDISIEYLEVRNADSLADFSENVDAPAVMAVAARLGTTRLIDNIAFGRST